MTIAPSSSLSAPSSVSSFSASSSPASAADRWSGFPAVRHIDDKACHPFLSTVELVGKRWSSAILLAIAQGSSRFSEIVATIPGLSDRLLAQRLRELESVELLQREVIPSTPVQVRYALTDRGAELLESLQPLVAWSTRWGVS